MVRAFKSTVSNICCATAILPDEIWWRLFSRGFPTSATNLGFVPPCVVGKLYDLVDGS